MKNVIKILIICVAILFAFTFTLNSETNNKYVKKVISSNGHYTYFIASDGYLYLSKNSKNHDNSFDRTITKYHEVFGFNLDFKYYDGYGNIVYIENKKMFFVDNDQKKRELIYENKDIVMYQNNKFYYKIDDKLFEYDYYTGKSKEIISNGYVDIISSWFSSIMILVNEGNKSIVKNYISYENNSKIRELKTFDNKENIRVDKGSYNNSYITEKQPTKLVIYKADAGYFNVKEIFSDEINNKIDINYFINENYYINNNLFVYIPSKTTIYSDKKISYINSNNMTKIEPNFIKVKNNNLYEYYYKGKKLNLDKNLEITNAVDFLQYKENKEIKKYDYLTDEVTTISYPFEILGQRGNVITGLSKNLLELHNSNNIDKIYLKEFFNKNVSNIKFTNMQVFIIAFLSVSVLAIFVVSLKRDYDKVIFL